jgi:hypothetical protein
MLLFLISHSAESTYFVIKLSVSGRYLLPTLATVYWWTVEMHRWVPVDGKRLWQLSPGCCSLVPDQYPWENHWGVLSWKQKKPPEVLKTPSLGSLSLAGLPTLSFIALRIGAPPASARTCCHGGRPLFPWSIVKITWKRWRNSLSYTS